MKRKWLPAAMLLLLGLAILLYPSVSKYLHRINSSYSLQQLTQTLENQDPDLLAQQLSQAELYNASLRGEAECPHLYENILNFEGGIMGCLEIPSIGVLLPIYHGVSETVLGKGVGHIPSTPFPIGGNGNHSVLTGHTGLPSAELFTGLSRLQIGDVFYIRISGKTLTYTVDSILTVTPSETDMLVHIPGEDYCTLVTCTPYGINSHRLLVRGSRSP